MESWSARAVRGVSIVNAVLVLTGFYFLLPTVFLFRLMTSYPSDEPYLAEAFFTMTAINLVCLVVLLVAVPYLWRLDRLGLVICNLLFAFEIFYFIAKSAIGLTLSMWGGKYAPYANSMAGAAGIGNMGLALQFLTAYPIIALTVLNIAYHKSKKLKEKTN